MRTTFALMMAVFVAGCLPIPAQAVGQNKQKPNFIIIIADDVGWDDLGCYGHPKIRTPNLNKMAKQGMKFNAAFLTTSSCSPSRASIMTGRYPHSTGAAELHQPLPANQVVFAGLLRQLGYYTAAAGKWHLGEAAKKNFDLVVGGAPSGAEKWLEVLKGRPQDRPFFLWLAALDAHRPYQPKTFDPPHTAKDVVLPPFLPDLPEVRKDFAMYYDEIARLDSYVGQVLAELERQGIAENTIVIFMSDNGRPFPRCKTTLYDSGIRTPFLVRWSGHIKGGSICDNLISSIDIAPSLIELAGGKKSPTFQGHSFARMLFGKGDGSQLPERPCGCCAQLTPVPFATRNYVFAEHNWHDYQAHERSVRSKKYLYIWNAFPHLTGSPPADAVRSPTYQAMLQLEALGKLPPQQRGCFIAPRAKEELYDVEKDPYSLKNLAPDPAHAETLKEMRAALEEWKRQTDDTLPAKPTPDKFDRKTGKPLS